MQDERTKLLRTNYSGNELIPNVRKFAKKLQITIHSIGAIKIEKSPKNNLSNLFNLLQDELVRGKPKD